MGRRSKRKKLLLRKANKGIELDPLEASRVGLQRIVDEQQKAKREAEAEKQRLIEEAKKKAELEKKKKAELEKKKKAESARKKKDTAVKKKKAAQDNKASK